MSITVPAVNDEDEEEEIGIKKKIAFEQAIKAHKREMEMEKRRIEARIPFLLAIPEGPKRDEQRRLIYQRFVSKDLLEFGAKCRFSSPKRALIHYLLLLEALEKVYGNLYNMM